MRSHCQINHLFCLAAALYSAPALALQGGMLTATVKAPPPAETGYFKLGATRSPDGHELTVNSRCVLLDGRSWFPVMGEFHYARCPADEWRDELLKMKAGGADIVSTYVFWIHHEEIEGQFDWSGQRDLRRFVQLCGDLGLKVVVRCGPWCHGEVRNGGLPDWVVAHKDWKLRSTDTNFLAAVSVLYGQIGKQVNGLLWKDGGPVIGVQVENEFGGSPEYLLALKKMAIAAGLDVPFYIKTGWPAMRRPVPLGELLPFFGAYADGFWERNTTPMNGNSWQNFTFKITRIDTGVGNDSLVNRQSGDTAGTEKYPYLTCEIGGGMETSYHRRMNLDPRDVEAVALCQLGSGSSLMGYYMYHGGQNPEGKLTTLQESQATGYPNDLPVKDYDFNAPLGEYGQVNPQYHWLRRLHLFLHDFGGELAEMPTALPDLRPTNQTDLATLRWAVRSDGHRGFVFVNNYQRLQPMPPKKNVQFKLNLPDGEFIFPEKPITIPADSLFFWPFNLDLGGIQLIYATAQPICRIDDGGGQTIFFVEIPGLLAEFAFGTNAVSVKAPSGKLRKSGGKVLVYNVKPGHDNAIRVKSRSGAQIRIVLLNEADSLALWKDEWNDRERVFLTRDGFAIDDGSLKSWVGDRWSGLEVFPLPERLYHRTHRLSIRHDRIFRWLVEPGSTARQPAKLEIEAVKPAGRARDIPLSTGRSHIALAPTEDDFTNAAVWRIKLPPDLKSWPHDDPIVRIHYIGDVARVTLNGRLIDDNFYSGRAFDIGVNRYLPDILTGDLRLEILPLRKDVPIYLPDGAKPEFGASESLVKLQSAEIVNRTPWKLWWSTKPIHYF